VGREYSFAEPLVTPMPSERSLPREKRCQVDEVTPVTCTPIFPPFTNEQDEWKAETVQSRRFRSSPCPTTVSRCISRDGLIDPQISRTRFLT
jgi:hypothetical protein